MLAAGTLVDNRFEILSALGQGGFGEVYVAQQVQLERKVALKLLKTEMADEEYIARFEREARILAELQHPNIAMFVAFGIWRDYRYTALEFVEGEALDKYLRRVGMLNSSATVKIAQRLLEALEHAHNHGVIHRDIKPGNIIVNADFGKTKLIDFGLAHIFAKQQLTQEGLAVGSVQYMSPEQCSGLHVDARSDLYSLGCILYECLTGQPAFVADDAVAVMFLQMNESRKLFAKGNEAIALFVNKLLEKDPENRFQTASEALAALNRLQVNDRVQPIGKHDPSTSMTARKPRKLATLIASTLIIAGIAGGALYWQSNQPKPVATFDFGPRLQETNPPMPEETLKTIIAAKFLKVDQAVQKLKTADPAGLPVLHTQIDNELRDIWFVTRESNMLHPEFVSALRRQMLLPWRDDNIRYQAAHYVAAISDNEPQFEDCAREALRIMTHRNDGRDCDDIMGMSMLLARLKIKQQNWQAAHQHVDDMLGSYARCRTEDSRNWKQEQEILRDAAHAMVGHPEMLEDREKLLRIADGMRPGE